MRTLDLTEDLTLTDGIYQVVGNTGSQYRLKNVATGERSVWHISDLLANLVDLPALCEASPRTILALSDSDREEVTFWSEHIEEVITGFHPRLSTPSPEYDPALTTQNERVEAKVLELRRAGKSASRATLLRKKKAFLEGGPAALIDGRKQRQVDPFAQVAKSVYDSMTAVIGRQANKATVTRSRLFELMGQDLVQNYGAAAKLPHRSSLYRHTKSLSKGRGTSGRATTRRSIAGTPDDMYTTHRHILPGQEVLVDSHTMDIMVRTAHGPQRPILTIMIDSATRCIVSITIRLKATKGYDHALLLAQALVPYQGRPDRSEHRALLTRLNKKRSFLSAAERLRLERMRPFIFPRKIVTDNGKDYLSEVFLSACQKFGIDIVQSAIHTPTDKALVERTFRSITTLFLEDLPGYVGSSPVDRGVDPKKGKPVPESERLLDLVTLTELLDDWVLETWNDRPHGGLRDPLMPSEKFSPNQWFNATADLAGVVALPLTREDFIDLLPSAWRTISPVGVQHKNRQYDSVELQPYRNLPSNLPTKNGQWEVKYNPYDSMHVWVRSRDNTWIECRRRDADFMNQPHFGDVHENLYNEERNDVAQQDAINRGVPMPAGTPLPETPTFETSGWDNADITDLDMNEYDDETDTNS